MTREARVRELVAELNDHLAVAASAGIVVELEQVTMYKLQIPVKYPVLQAMLSKVL